MHVAIAPHVLVPPATSLYSICKAEECAIELNSRIKQNIAAFLHTEGIRRLNAYDLLDAQSIKTSLVQMKGKENRLSLSSRIVH